MAIFHRFILDLENAMEWNFGQLAIKRGPG